MGQRTTDEIEAAGAELGADTLRVGFYSYGEISPHAKSGMCELHNQTMTVTSFAEVGGTAMHRLVIQQIAKATDAAGKVDIDRFADLVSRAYDEFDRDRRRTDRSMALMIEEIDTINRNLERARAERTRELRARESDLQTQNLRFEAALSNMTQGLLLYDSIGDG